MCASTLEQALASAKYAPCLPLFVRPSDFVFEFIPKPVVVPNLYIVAVSRVEVTC
jgi:hypothetical protein